MKKWTLLFLSLLLAFGTLDAQNKNQGKRMKIAVMDFKAGVGVNNSEVEGLSDMLINTLYESGRFSIVERSQINQVLKEQKFQSSDLSYEQVAKVGRILGVKAVLVGTVNNIGGEYNVDIRAVNVESAMIVATAGATKTASSTYRQTLEKIGKQLAENLEDEPEPIEETKQEIILSGIMKRDGRDLTLYGRELSNEEVRTLVGQDNYETYLSARKQITVGRVFTPIFYASLGLTIVFVVVNEEVPAVITGPIAAASLPMMLFFKGVGKGRMDWVAEEYNNSHSSVSYNLSPSVMRINAPQSQGNVAFGLTLSVNF